MFTARFVVSRTFASCHVRARILRQAEATMTTAVRQEIKKHVGFMGSGKMAQALVKGFLTSGSLKPSQITMTDRTEESRLMVQQFGAEYMHHNDEMARKSDVIFVCVKPNVILPALQQIFDCLQDKLVVSVAAGTTIEQIRQVMPNTARLIRVMPNTPCLVQSGTAVYASGPNVLQQDLALVNSLCRGTFTVFEEVPESMINAVSGISGCGPAYIFMVAEALADGGVRMGIPRSLAHKLAVSTILGAAKMMEETGEDPAKLKNDVCSPGGATIAAIHALELGGVRAAFMNAVQAAALRSQELNKQC